MDKQKHLLPISNYPVHQSIGNGQTHTFSTYIVFKFSVTPLKFSGNILKNYFLVIEYIIN
jgi:hypothetical protein